MKKVRLGLIGLGNIALTHAQRIVDGKVPDLELVAAANKDTSRRAWFKKFFPRAVFFDNAEELMSSGLCDAVLIATPHYSHPALAMSAFKSGLHVLCEKPSGVYTSIVREMNAAAENSGKVFGMVFDQRANPLYKKMHALVTSKEFGEIKRVSWIATNWYRPQAYYDSGGWRATWAGEGGGTLINQCVHQLDLLQWVCGLPKTVYAKCHNGKWHNIEVEDDVTAYMEFPNGATGVFVASTADAPGVNRFEATLEMGGILCDGDKLVISKLNQNEREFCKTATGGFDKPQFTKEEILAGGQTDPYAEVLKAFAAKILYGQPLIAEGVEGINSLTLSNAMYLSSWLGTDVSIPFDEGLFLSELNNRIAESKAKRPQ